MDTIKDLCEQLALNDKILRENMSDLLALRQRVVSEAIKEARRLRVFASERGRRSHRADTVTGQPFFR
jgi:ribosomal protein S18